MKENTIMKILSVVQSNSVSAAIGFIGSTIAAMFGGWDIGLQTLVAFMAVDYITGLVIAAKGKSPKSPNGGLSSKAGWNGLLKKFAGLVMVFVACRLDLLIGSAFVRDAVVIALITNELISLLENLNLLGVPKIEVISKALDMLKNKTNESINLEETKNDKSKEV